MAPLPNPIVPNDTVCTSTLQIATATCCGHWGATIPPGAPCHTNQQARQCPGSQTCTTGNNSSCQLILYMTCVTTAHIQGESQEKKVLVSDFLDGPHTSAEIVTKFSNADGPISQRESECLRLRGQGHLSLFKLEK